MSSPPEKERPIRQPGEGQTNRLPDSVIADYQQQSPGVYDATAWVDGALVLAVDPFDRLVDQLDGFSAEPLPPASPAESERLRKIFAVVAVTANGRGEPDPFQVAMSCAALTIVCGDDRFTRLPTLRRYARRLGVSVELLSRRVEKLARLLGLPNPCERKSEHRQNLSAARRRVLAEKADVAS